MEEKSDIKTNVYYEFIFKRGNIREAISKFDSEKKCFYKVLSQKKSYLITI